VPGLVVCCLYVCIAAGHCATYLCTLCVGRLQSATLFLWQALLGTMTVSGVPWQEWLLGLLHVCMECLLCACMLCLLASEQQGHCHGKLACCWGALGCAASFPCTLA